MTEADSRGPTANRAHGAEGDRAAGYVTDSPYTDTFFRELAPTWLNYVAVLNGAAPHDLSAPFSYLELGAGFGHSLIANAGAFPHAEFHGCDIHPEHAAGARRHAATFGARNLHFHEAAFDDLLDRDLPSFDFIALHGVLSWVDEAARAAVRRLIARLLKPDGIVYASYNSLPGWASELPLRRLLIELAATERGDSARRSAAARDTLAGLAAAGLRYVVATPEAQAALKGYQNRSGRYLAHEFLNRAWQPFYSVDVADDFAACGLRRIGSATLADNHLPLCVDERSAAALMRLPTARQRELALDFAVNRRFRRDVLVRDAAALASTSELARNLNALAIGSVGDPAAITPKLRVPRGEIAFNEQFVAEVARLMAAGSSTIGAAVDALAGGAQGRDSAEIARNLVFLVAGGALQPFAIARSAPQSPGPPMFANARVAAVVKHVAATGAVRAAPSTVLGNGVEVDPSDAATVLAAVERGEPAAASAPLLAAWRRLELLV